MESTPGTSAGEAFGESQSLVCILLWEGTLAHETAGNQACYNSGKSGKKSLVSFRIVLCKNLPRPEMVTPKDFIHTSKSYNYIVNNYYHVKVLLKRFHLNGDTTGFHSQI